VLQERLYTTTTLSTSLRKSPCVRSNYCKDGSWSLTTIADSVQALPETETESEHLPTIESIAAERQKRKAVQAQLDAQAQKEAQSRQHNAPPADGAEGGIEGLEAEADQQGAFNPETGEINWDCPCLGGMATGPCGEQFKAAFSCFVYSEEEPKGMDCIDKFKYVQKTNGDLIRATANN
jgi:intermembrane space import and assembly protein 40